MNAPGGWITGAAAALALGVQATRAADYYVDNAVGQDAFNGLAAAVQATNTGPFRTVTRALRAAGPGDTVHLNPTGQLYRDMADFYGLKGGEPDRPLVLDGHGTTLSGADPCPPEGWEPWRDGILQRQDMPCRGFMVVDDRMVFERLSFNALRPGELCYLGDFLNIYPPTNRPLSDLRIEVGQPDGSTVTVDPARWHPTHSVIREVRRYPGLRPPTWVKVDGRETPLLAARERLEPGMWCRDGKTLYYRPPAGRTPADLRIECVIRDNGVQMSGETAHVVVRHLNVVHVANDGFNIHGHVTHAEFYDCNARDCGDAGFSAHDACETLLDGAVYVNCDNGIANVNQSGFSITRNVILQGARSVGYLLQGAARHELRHAILVDNPHQFSGLGVEGDNLLLVQTRSASRPCSALTCGGTTVLSRVTVVGHAGLFRTDAGASVTLNACLLGGGQGALHIRADDPLALLRLRDVVGAPDLTVEWGSRYPWKTQPLGEWLGQAAAAGAATNCTVRDLPGLAALRAGQKPGDLPAGLGCTPELIERFLAHFREAL